MFGTIDAFADAMDMSRSALSRKLNGVSPWTHLEIERACDLLDISITMVVEYFFYED
jgi:hypothetical protein